MCVRSSDVVTTTARPCLESATCRTNHYDVIFQMTRWRVLAVCAAVKLLPSSLFSPGRTSIMSSLSPLVSVFYSLQEGADVVSCTEISAFPAF